MAVRVYANNVSTKLTAQLLVAGTTANVTAGDGALFAGANGTDWIIGTLRRMSGYRDVAREIVRITNRSTDALTITRAQEGTTALQFEIGDQLDVDWTATSLSDASSARTPRTASPTYAASITQSITEIDQINIGILTGNLTLALSGGADGQAVRIRFEQDGTGSRILTLDAKFRLGADITAVTLSTAINKIDYLGVIYHSGDDKYDVVAFTKGF